MEIGEVAKGRLYALVNKFDQKDAHGDDAEQTKNYVANGFLREFLHKEDIYPVSSQYAYLANLARRELDLNGKLPALGAPGNAWVEDFCKKAFGEFWEEDIKDMEEIARRCSSLWRKSRFSEPLEKVVNTSHAHAAMLVVDASAAKLLEYAQKVESFLNVRLKSFTQSAKEIRKAIALMEQDVAEVGNAQASANGQLDKMRGDFDDEIRTIFECVKQDVLQVLSDYFKTGKIAEEERVLIAEEKRRPEKNSTRPTFLRAILESLRGGKQKRKYSSKFDPSNPVIRFESEPEAKNFVDEIRKIVNDLLKGAENALRESTQKRAETFEAEFCEQAKSFVEAILGKAEQELKEQGFSVVLRLPDFKKVDWDIEMDASMEAVIKSHKRKETHYRRQSGVWGTICDWFNTDDWGWEEYQETVREVRVDTRKIETLCMKGVGREFEGLGKAVASGITEPLTREVKEFFGRFRELIENVRGDLLRSLSDSRKSKAEQDAIVKELESWAESKKGLLEDAEALRKEIKQIVVIKKGGNAQ
jgi:hypothetical protein